MNDEFVILKAKVSYGGFEWHSWALRYNNRRPRSIARGILFGNKSFKG